VKRCACLLLVLGFVLSMPAIPRGQSDVAFPAEVYAARRARLIGRTGDAMVIVPGRYLIGQEPPFRHDPNFWYLTGVEAPYAILVIARTSGQTRTALFLPEQFQFAGGQFPMQDDVFRRAAWNLPRRRLVPSPEAAKVTGVDEALPLARFDARLTELLAGVNTVYLPLDDAAMYAPPGLTAPVSVAKQISDSIRTRLGTRKVENVLPLVARMRMVKDAHEIAALRTAAAISGQGMVAALRGIRPGLNDREVAGLMEYVWKQAGSPRTAFSPVVSSGSNAMTFFSLIGESYNTTDRVMRAGDLLFVDYGAAEYKTYAADICRTFPVSGRFTPEQRKYYDIVLEAQLAAIAAIKPGVMMVDVIKKSAEVFRKHGLEQFEDPARMGVDRVWGVMPSPTHYLARNAGIVPYTPRGVGVRDLGHHIGLETHDSRNYSVPLEPGMVVTIEPKIYIPDQNIAIMIEDMILVTADGNENLSSTTPKTAAEIEAAMEVGDPTRPLNGTVVAFPSGTLTLHGVMWKPEGQGPFPAVLFNHGSEFAPRDLPELGPLFARHGYVLFGPTRRGHGRSTDQAPYIGQELARQRQKSGTAAWSRLLVRLLETDHLDDQLAGLEYLKAQPFVDASRIAVMGGSFGGIQTMLAAEKAQGIRAAVNFAGGAQSWADAPDLRERMLSAARNATVPVFLIQAENDYDITPSRVLAAEMDRLKKPHRMKIYPPWGRTTRDGHVFGVRGSSVWERDVFAFLDEHLTPSPRRSAR
jgi:Xaa-Pro aminopeptidase/dienelactone hydrolase